MATKPRCYLTLEPSLGGEVGEGGENVWKTGKMHYQNPLPAVVSQWCVTCLHVAERTRVSSRMGAGRTPLAHRKGEGAGGGEWGIWRDKGKGEGEGDSRLPTADERGRDKGGTR